MSAGPLLSVRDLVVTAALSGRRAVDGVSFDIASGEIMAVVGESGSGKTATGRAIIGLLPPGLAATGGSALFDGRNLIGLAPEPLRRLRGPGIGMVFQEPMTSLNPAHTIGRQLAEGLALHQGLDPAETRRRCLAMLARVGIADPERSLAAFPHEFSGGMRQRIMLASVMLLKPRLIIADEPTTALDTLTQAEVLDLMVELTREQGSAVMLITHNLGLVARYAQRAVVMRDGRIVEQGGARALLAAPREDYTRALVDALPRRRPRRAVPGDAPAVIAARGLAVEFRRRRLFGAAERSVAAVKGVDLVIRRGEAVALVGGSGSGKTTFGRAILRLVETTGGAIAFGSEDVSHRAGRDLRAFRKACQIVFQDPYSSLDPRMRVREIVAEPLRLADGLDAAARAGRTEAMLADVGLEGFGARFPHELSGGQRQRVAIARALVGDPAFVVADEPVSALDMTIQKQVLSLFQRLQEERGFACLFISHDLGAVAEVADRVAVMQAGRIVEIGAVDDIFERPQHPYTRALLAASPALHPDASPA